MKIVKVPMITDVKTGEQIAIIQATPMQVSNFLTDVNFKRKNIEKVEKAIKDWVKKNFQFKWDEDNHAIYGEHRVSIIVKHDFDEATMLEKEKDKKFVKKYLEVKDKYIKAIEYIKF